MIAWHCVHCVQVVLNLLTNAIKFTPHGRTVTLRLAQRAEADGGESAVAGAPDSLPLLLSVSDEGIGIHPNDQDLIFLKYTKATDARGGDGVDRHTGAGLGLSICKAIVDKHNGQMSVESALGAGSTFRVSLDLPLVLKPAPRASAGETSPIRPKDLVADPLDGV
jgi:signal transduction histidine kinase